MQEEVDSEHGKKKGYGGGKGLPPRCKLACMGRPWSDWDVVVLKMEGRRKTSATKIMFNVSSVSFSMQIWSYKIVVVATGMHVGETRDQEG